MVPERELWSLNGGRVIVNLLMNLVSLKGGVERHFIDAKISQTLSSAIFGRLPRLLLVTKS